MQELLPPPGTIRTLPDGRRLMSRPAPRSMGKLEPVYLPAAGSPGNGSFDMWGEVEVRNGPGTCFVENCNCDEFHFISRNKIVGQGLRHLINQGIGGTGVGNNSNGFPFATNDPTNSYIRVDTGSGATIDTTVGLVAPNTTNPNATTLAFTNPSAGVYRGSFTATWNSGTLTAITVTEIGIFGRLAVTLGTLATNNGANLTSLALFARLSVTDTEFSSFVVNTAAPLVIEYRVTNTFT